MTRFTKALAALAMTGAVVFATPAVASADTHTAAVQKPAGTTDQKCPH